MEIYRLKKLAVIFNLSARANKLINRWFCGTEFQESLQIKIKDSWLFVFNVKPFQLKGQKGTFKETIQR